MLHRRQRARTSRTPSSTATDKLFPCRNAASIAIAFRNLDRRVRHLAPRRVQGPGDNYRTPHSDKLHVVERYRMVEGGKTMVPL
jgi:hypothetical protein